MAATIATPRSALCPGGGLLRNLVMLQRLGPGSPDAKLLARAE